MNSQSINEIFILRKHTRYFDHLTCAFIWHLMFRSYGDQMLANVAEWDSHHMKNKINFEKLLLVCTRLIRVFKMWFKCKLVLYL